MGTRIKYTLWIATTAATNVDDQTIENISRDIKIEIVRARHPNETAAMTADETVLPTKAQREEAVHVTAETATTHPEVDNRLHHLHAIPIPILEVADLHQAAHAPSKPNSSPYRT